MHRLILAALLLGFAVPTAHAQVTFLINEVDADQTGTDGAEFVELYASQATPAATPLDGLVLVFFNGNLSNNGSYIALDLDGLSTTANGLFVICANAATVPNCTFDAPGAITNYIQNGADAVALYTGNATDFPSGTTVATSTSPRTAGLLDVVVYGAGNLIDADLLTAFGLPATYQFEEFYNGATAGGVESLARLNVPTGATPTISGLLYTQVPSPGALNGSTVTVDETAGVDNVAGWRLLGFPVVRPISQGALSHTVNTLAGINLVQGVPAGVDQASVPTPAQYPTAGDNVLTSYNGGTTSAAFLAPATTGEVLDPGEGFFWYFYDQDIVPDPASFGGGTSRSYELTNPAFALRLNGLALDNRFFGGGPYQTTAVPVTASGFYMGANPFAYPAALSALGVSAGTLSSNFSVYNPTTGSYETLTSAAVVAPWQGVFLQVTGVPGGTTTVAFTASSNGVVPTSAVTLVGRTASAGDARLNFRLDGALASGVAVADHATAVRFLDDAEAGWDRHDGSKLTPPQADYALVAFAGERDGVEDLQAVRSLPSGLQEAVTTPMRLRTTDAGTFSLSWDATSLPAGLRASLRDLATGTVVDLRASEAYDFTADAADWAARFELVLTPDAVVATEGTPETVSLGAAYPNPSATSARLALRVDAAQRVTATVVDALGRTVATVFEGALAAGAEQALVVPTMQLAPGVYVVRVQGATFQQSRRLVVAR